MMERRFDMSDFEQSLKDHADQFNMVPSRSVWRGIYNNLYPGRKWPSITVAIVFIITLFTIGHLNNSPKREDVNQLSKPVQNESVHENIALSNAIKNSDELTEAEEANNASNPNYSNSLSYEKDLLKNSVTLNQTAIQVTNEENSSTVKKHSPASHTTTAAPTNLFPNSNDILTQNRAIVKNYNLSMNKMNRTDLVMSESLRKYVEGNPIFSNNGYDVTSNSGNSIISKPIFSFARFVTNELSLVDNNSLFADAMILKEQDKNSLLNRIGKKIKNVRWMYYLTPSLSSASFINKDARGIRSNFSLLQNRSANGMMYKAGLGLEGGAQASYKLSGNWDFITGANIRYSGYNVVSNLVHPTFATLSFRDNNTGLDYSKSYITHYGNGMTQNQINLLNYSLQASVPVGLQYHIWQDKNVQINLLSTVDLSAVLKSNAYIISSDGRYYVKDPSLSRPVNMGINFNPNIVLSGQKIKWHLGPSVRYQLYSRYKNNYQAKEHLIDYGIRIGISK